MDTSNQPCPGCEQEPESSEALTEDTSEIKLTYEDKITICRSCPNLIPVSEKCNLCGCYMQVKARFPFFHCPEEKW